MKRPTRNRILSAALAGASFAAFSLSSLPVLAESSIVVRNFVLSHGIHEREPISETESFHVEDGKAFAFARIQNTGDPTMVSFVWEIDDTTHATVPVSVGASHGWRTWSTARLRPGSWRVKLIDDQGEILLEKAFTVDSSSSPSVAGAGNDISGPEDTAISDDIPTSVTFPAR
jgi:hypothetical protein